MKTALRLIAILSLAALAALFAQGPLAPPPGAPAPTMKSLAQIEPRTDLQATLAPTGVDTTNPNYHFIINAPGSYYLSANLAVTKTHGIQINAEGVTLDLNGFDFVKGSTGNGIEIVGTAHRASVRNGSIKGFGYGVVSLSTGCAFRDLVVSGCFSYGIRADRGSVLESCRAYQNGGTRAISAGIGSSLTNCTAVGNTVNEAIFASAGSALANCTAANNSAIWGIYADEGSSLTNCSAISNQNSISSSGGIGTGAGCTVTNCTSRENASSAATETPLTGMGFWLGQSSTIQNCTASMNKGDGIRIDSDSVARHNNCDSNGSGDGAGIHASGSENRIESNNLTEQDRGVDVDGAGNLIIKNSAANNTTNYDLAANNVFGAIVNRNIPGSPAVSGSSAASSAGTTDPWANFSY